jgi:hypothetical protein
LTTSASLSPASAQERSAAVAQNVKGPPHAYAKVAHAMAVPRLAPARPRYFIEFRARTHFYGHVYAAYGRLNERGQPVNVRVAGLYPNGGAAGFALGHVVPVPATLDGVEDDWTVPATEVYRRVLNQAEYDRLLATIAELHEQPHVWHAVTYNCVTFAALLAQAVDLYTPPVPLLPVPFVMSLRLINGS